MKKSKSPVDISKHLYNTRKSIVTDANLNWPRLSGYYSKVRLAFCYVDYLGLLYSGRLDRKTRRLPKHGSSEFGVKFLKRFFGAVDQRYRDNAGLLYEMYRHGTVHLYQPKMIIKLKNGSITYLVGHPRILKWKNKKYAHLKYEAPYLPISTRMLFKDLLKAFDRFMKYIATHTSIKEQGNKILRAVEKPLELDELSNWAKQSKLVKHLSR